jgi:hypothetical protein
MLAACAAPRRRAAGYGLDDLVVVLDERVEFLRGSLLSGATVTCTGVADD